jgi:hypothetical protein
MVNVIKFLKDMGDKLFKDKIISLFGIIIFALFVYFIIYSFNTYRNYSVLLNIPSKHKIEYNDYVKRSFNKIELSPNEKGDTIGGILNPIIGLMGVLLTFLAFYVQYQANNRILNYDNEKKSLLNKKIEKAVAWELKQVNIYMQLLDKEYDDFKAKINEVTLIDTFNTYIVFEREIFNNISFINVIDIFEYNELIDIYKISNNIEYLKKNIPSKLNEIIQEIPLNKREEEVKKIFELFPVFKDKIIETKELIKPIVLKYKK